MKNACFLKNGLGVLVLFTFIFFSSCKPEPTFIGNTYDVGCGNAADMVIEGETFDFRPHNSCGNGLLFYTRTATSESGNVTAEFRIDCSVGFCIGNVLVLSWED